MELEFSIEDLLNKRRIESDRIEFKKGWNPDDIYQSICAFANDFDNQGGGYIVVGAEEKDGVVIRPVCGIPLNALDRIQKDMVGLNHKIQPSYFAKLIPDVVDGKNILVLWVPTGIQRPYKTVEHVTSKKDNNYKYFIRYGTSSVVASPEQEHELLAMSAREPFDVQGNPKATIDDISPLLLAEHLKETGSKLAKQVQKLGVQEILDEMQLLDGPPERLRVKNVALMMFCDKPDCFFPYMEVDIVWFPNGSIKDPNNFIEIPPIKGTVPQIIRRTMDKLQDMIIADNVRKVGGKMEANRNVSYPYAALEEAVVNAFYHRDYMSYEPVHIEIEPDCINIISYPGIDRSIPMDVIKKGERFRTRIYRNRRLGEFLKELHLTEGKCTCVPTIQEELEKIGSPRAKFETDDDRKAVCVTIPIQPDYLKNADFGRKNADIEGKDADIESLKAVYTERLKANGNNKITIEKMIMLLNTFGVETVFGRDDVIAAVGGGHTAASGLLKKMENADVTVAASGQGKGKYHFRTEI